MPASFPPLAALFLTHFHDLTGQEVVYYRSVGDLAPGLIEHASLPSGLHMRAEDLIVFTHGGYPGAGLFRSRAREGEDAGRGRTMGTLGVVLAPPTPPEAVFDLAAPLGNLYDRLEGLHDVFAKEGADADAARALLDTVWDSARADGLAPAQAHSATSLASRLAKGVSTHSPVTYMPALLSMLGPSIVTVFKASLSGQRVLLYSPPPLRALGAFAWCVWAIGLPPAAAANSGARASAWLGNVGLMDLDAVKARRGGWIGTTTDVVYKSHADAYDVFIDLSGCMPDAASEDDVRAPRGATPTPPTITVSSPPPMDDSPTRAKPTTSTVTYAFADLALYRSLVLLDQSPRGVHADTVGFSATNRSGGVWLVVFEMLERIWHLCVGVCEFALGRGRVGSGGHIELPEGEEDARGLLAADISDFIDEDEGEDDEDGEGVGEGRRGDTPPTTVAVGATVPDDVARRGRLILDQLHHNAYHLYARLLHVAAGGWELTDDNLRSLTGASRLNPWGGRGSVDAQFWLRLARTWNVEPEVADGL